MKDVYDQSQGLITLEGEPADWQKEEELSMTVV